MKTAREETVSVVGKSVRLEHPMTPDKRERMRAVFDQAAELPPDKRGAFLDSACGTDIDLRNEVEQLLAHKRMTDEQATTAPADSSFIVPSSSFQEPPRIGHYRILRQIGEGGMGTVYEAEQENPRRRVALKVLRPGIVSPRPLRRFSHEAQILGRLHHVGIAEIYEAGLATDGRPFFAMEFVGGSPLDDYVRNNSVDVSARLALVAKVCDAVQHAHDRGVVHRDLKPANIMVDETGQPKVLDFGVARVTEADLRTTTARTEIGQLIGTLSYMSPEQVVADPAALDRRADVYSLGVILFELLADRLPYHLDHIPLPEVARVIHDQEPSRLGSINTLYRGDIETIVAKALEKDKARRYASAGDLAADIRHHLKGEPIVARPTGRMERGWKWTRRNPVLASLLAAMAILLVSGTVVSSALALWAMRGWDQADQNAHDLRLSLERETAERQRAEDKEKTANARDAETRAVLGFVEEKVFAAARPKGARGGLGRNVPLRDAVEAGLPFVDSSFRDQPLIEARLRMTLGTSFWYLGDTKIAAEQFEKARSLYTQHLGPEDPLTLRSLTDVANTYAALGRHADALKLREETLALQKVRLGLDHADTLRSMNNLAASYHALGRPADALKLIEGILAMRRAQLGPDHPDTLMSMHNLANGYSALGRHADALKLREDILALRKAKLGRSHPDTLETMHNLAASYYNVGRRDDALRLAEETLLLMKTELGPNHDLTLACMTGLAVNYAAHGRHADALKLREEVLAIREVERGRDHPDTLIGMWGVAESLAQLDRGSEAVPVIDECVRRAAGQIVHPQLIPTLMDLRLRHFEKIADAAGCRATAETWEKLNRPDAESLYRAACMRAVTAAISRTTDPSETAAKDATAEEDLALAWLKKAITAGYKDTARMSQDKDLDTLRGREDFKKLLAELHDSKQ